MSIHLINHAAMGLMQSAQYQAQVTSNNMANVRTEGYSARKVVQSGTSSQGIGTGVEITRVYSEIDRFLERSLASNLSGYSFKKTLAENLKGLASVFGNLTNKDSTISAKISLFEAKLVLLQNKPNSAENRMQAVKALEALTDGLRNISKEIQQQRTRVSHEIETRVGELNVSLKEIHTLNEEIAKLTASGQSSTDLEDKRRVALKALSKQIGVSYFIDGQNRAIVSTNKGSLLIGKYAKEMTYQSPAVLGKDSKYPLSIPAISIDGKDVTVDMDEARIGALVRFRDQDLVQKQDELDQFAFQLKNKLNQTATKGVPYPLADTILGTVKHSLGASLSMSGQIQVALSDSKGQTQTVHTVGLAGVSTVGDLVSKLNGLPGVSAGLDAKGQFKISAGAGGQKIAIIPLNEKDSSTPSRNLKQILGIDTLLSGTGAGDLKINMALKANPDLLPGARPNLIVGQALSSPSDVRNLTELLEGLKSNQFLAAGKIPSKVTSFKKYSVQLLSGLAEETRSFQKQAEVDENVIKAMKRDIASKSGVNMNEEIANLSEHQKSFEVAGQIMKTAQEMFNTLMRLSR